MHLKIIIQRIYISFGSVFFFCQCAIMTSVCHDDYYADDLYNAVRKCQNTWELSAFNSIIHSLNK